MSPTGNPDELLMPMMVATGLLTVVLTISMLSVVMVAGPTMVNIIGTLKDVVLTYIGLQYFDASDNSGNLLLMAGLGISFIGAVHSVAIQY